MMTPLLKFYDPARRSKISSDALKDGLGAVLLQEHDGMEINGMLPNQPQALGVTPQEEYVRSDPSSKTYDAAIEKI